LLSLRGGTVHILAQAEVSEYALKQILQKQDGRVSVLDLTATVPGSPSGLRERVADLIDASEKEIVWIEGSDFASDLLDKTLKILVNWLSEVSESDLIGNKSIKELFTYDNYLSLWWLTDISVKHPNYHIYPRLLFQIQIIEHVIENFYDGSDGVAGCHLWVRDSVIGEVLREAIGSCTFVRVHTEQEDSSWSSSFVEGVRQKVKRGWRIARGLVALLLTLGRILRWVWYSNRQLQLRRPIKTLEDITERPMVLLATSFPHSWCKLGPSERFRENVKWIDRYFGDMPWRLEEAGIRSVWLPMFVSPRIYQLWQRWSDEQTLPDALPSMILDWQVVPKLAWYGFVWWVKYLWLFEIRRIHKRWRYQMVPLGHWLKEDYYSLSSGEALMNLLKLESIRSACDRLEPDVLLCRNEFYVHGRVVSAAAGSRPRVFSLQHGLINSRQTVYQFDQRDIGLSCGSESDYVLHCPVPERFLAFGSYVVELFEQWQGYPHVRVLPIGGVRHDRLVERFTPIGASSIQRESLRRELGLPVDLPVVLICTGFVGQAKQLTALTIQGLQKARLKAFIVVKLHQYHGGESVVRETALALGFKNYEVFRDSVYSLISCSDVTVAGCSTTVIESFLLSTPAILVGTEAEQKAYPFEDLAQVVSSTDEMADALKSVLHCRTGMDAQLGSGQREHILKTHLNNADADACKRLIQLIRNGDSV
jgi:surface carbohydrate biosynthesis protein (TIGR04326 family)